jgi:hypothetical protein
MMRTTWRRVRRTATALVAAAGCAAGAGSWSSSAWAQSTDGGAPTISWGGLEWNVKSHLAQKPGPNNWSAANVTIDGNGDLHLAITNVGGTWYCSEVWTNAILGFGTFQWQILTPTDQLDPNVVLGAFLYGPPGLGPDGTNEIDVEWSRFGTTGGNDGRWTVWPNTVGTPNPPVGARMPFSIALGTNPATTARFDWEPTSVAFTMLSGLEDVGSSANMLGSWTYQPASPTSYIGRLPMPVHMNLYLYGGSPPINGQGVEVVFHSFTRVGSTTANPVPALPRHDVILLAAFLLGIGLVWIALRRRTFA